MKMKKWIALVSIFGLLGCLGETDDALDYNPYAQLEIDLAAIDEYLEENNITAEVHEQTQIRYVITTEGSGDNPVTGNFVAVDYELYDFDGNLLDTSIESVAQDGGIHNSNRTYAPLEFQIGTNGVITGFQYATLLLKEGGSGDFYIPSVWAYQNIGSGNIGPNENLIFKITLVEINP